MFVAKGELLTNALKAKVQMTKGSLYDVIRSNNDFSNASVIVFAFGDDGDYCMSWEGHWLIFAVDLVNNMIYCYCSVNRHPGSQELCELIKTVFIAPHLSFMKEIPGKVSSSKTFGKVTLNKECIEQAQAFRRCNVMLPTVPVEDYACGFWAAEIMLQLCMDKVSLVDGVNVTFNLEEYRKYLSELVQTRYLGINGTLRRARPQQQQQQQPQPLVAVAVAPISAVLSEAVKVPELVV